MPPPQQQAATASSTTVGDNLTVVGGAGDANDGAQEIILTTATHSAATPGVGFEGPAAAATVVSPEKQSLHNTIAPTQGSLKDTHAKGNVAAIVSPEKGI